MSYDNERRELELEAARDVIAVKDAEIARLRARAAELEKEVLDLTHAGHAADVGNIYWEREAKEAIAQLAAMREQALDECEAIARGEVGNHGPAAHDMEDQQEMALVARDTATLIADAIGALKRKGDQRDDK